MVAWPVTFATSAPLSENPPVPIAATLAFATGVWSVQFDKPLSSGALDPLNWTFVATNTAFAASSAAAAGDTVSGASTNEGPFFDSDRVDYAPPPNDVIDLQGRPAASFGNFPLVVT